MEFIKQYWWVLAIAAVLLLLMRGRGGSGPTVPQIRGGIDPLAAAPLELSGDMAEDQNRIGLISSLLNFDLARSQLATDRELSILGLQSSERTAQLAAQNQSSLLAQQLAFQQMQAQLQANMQTQAINAQAASQRRSGILGAIMSGINILPSIFGANRSGGGGFGGFGTPTTFPSGGSWGWG